MDDDRRRLFFTEASESRPNKRKSTDTSDDPVPGNPVWGNIHRHETSNDPDAKSTRSDLCSESLGESAALSLSLDQKSNLLTTLQNVQAAHAQTQQLHQQLHAHAQQEHTAFAARSRAQQLSNILGLQQFGVPVTDAVAPGLNFIQRQAPNLPQHPTFVTQLAHHQISRDSEQAMQTEQLLSQIQQRQQQHHLQAQFQLQLQLLQRQQQQQHSALLQAPPANLPGMPVSAASNPPGPAMDFQYPFVNAAPPAYFTGARMEMPMYGFTPNIAAFETRPHGSTAKMAQALSSGANGPRVSMAAASAVAMASPTDHRAFPIQHNQANPVFPVEAAMRQPVLVSGAPWLPGHFIQQHQSHRDGSIHAPSRRDESNMQGTSSSLQYPPLGLAPDDSDAQVSAGAGAGGGDGRQRHSKYCHFCQHIKASMLACGNPQCTFRFCRHCLSTHLEESWDQASDQALRHSGAWMCPCCRKNCCCCALSACGKDHPHCKAYRKRMQDRNVVASPPPAAPP